MAGPTQPPPPDPHFPSPADHGRSDTDHGMVRPPNGALSCGGARGSHAASRAQRNEKADCPARRAPRISHANRRRTPRARASKRTPCTGEGRREDSLDDLASRENIYGPHGHTRIRAKNTLCTFADSPTFVANVRIAERALHVRVFFFLYCQESAFIGGLCVGEGRGR